MAIRTKLLWALGSAVGVLSATAAGFYGKSAPVYTVLLLLAALAAHLLVSLLFTRRVNAPLAQLRKHTADAFEDRQLRVTCNGGDEWAALAREINNIIDHARTADDEAAKFQAMICEYENDIARARSMIEEQAARRSRDLLATADIAITDSLTGLRNRREALDQLKQLWLAKNLHGDRLSCIFLDIDHFKSFNDSYGHATGDKVLQEVAAVLREKAREFDTVYRVGGEEFLVLCRKGCMEGAVSCAEQLRCAVEAHSFQHGNLQLHVTISLGVAERTDAMQAPEDLLNLADERLYAAKRAGRNCVVAVDSPAGPSAQASSGVGKTEGHFRTEIHPLPETAPIRVLLAEEDETMRTEWAALLSRHGIEVVQASDGHDVLSMAQQSRFDTLVLSASLSGVCGLECIRVLRNEPSTCNVPAILLANERTDSSIQPALDLNVHEAMERSAIAQLLPIRVKSLGRMYRGTLELMRTNQKHQEEKHSVSRLFAFSRSLSQTPALEQVLEKTLEVTKELLHCKRACVLLPDKKRESLVIAKAVGLDDVDITAVTLPLNSAMARLVFRSEKPLVINTPEEAQRAGLVGHFADLSKLPVAFFALRSQSQTLAVLWAAEKEGDGRFGWQEIEYICQAATVSASAMADIMSCKAQEDARDAVVEALGTLAEYRDDNSGQHVLRVTQYSLLLAGILSATDGFTEKIDEQFQSDLIRAVPLHDLGKVGIPDRILLKNRALTHEERAIMQSHVDIGVDTIRSVRRRIPSAGYLGMAEDIAAGHHEWFNGAGYPRGLKGTAIPLAARIVALADVYDALTTERPYKTAYRHADAAQVIYQSSGKQFDPWVVEAFRKREQQFATLADALADRKPRTFADPFQAGADACRHGADPQSASLYELAPLD